MLRFCVFHLFRETIDALGRLTTFGTDQLEVLAAKLSQEDAFGPDLTLWKAYHIAAAGHVIGI